MKQSSISEAKRRQSIPAQWLIKLMDKRGINPEWIRCGADAKYLEPRDAKPTRNCASQDLVHELLRRALQ